MARLAGSLLIAASIIINLPGFFFSANRECESFEMWTNTGRKGLGLRAMASISLSSKFYF